MRKAGDVVFTDVDSRNSEGIVEFSNRDDMNEAIRKLDDTEFKNPYDAQFIRVKSANKGGRDDSRDRDDSRKERDDSRSRSRSPDRKKNRSPSRSRSISRCGMEIYYLNVIRFISVIVNIFGIYVLCMYIIFDLFI